MKRTNAILGLLAQTSIHAGTGQHTGAIDLPIQREGHNGWPCVFGSAVKGALRTHAEQCKLETLTANGIRIDDDKPAQSYDTLVKNDAAIAAVYGPSTSNASEHAGGIIVTDARLLLLPVRSLTSQFKWVTCPDALARLRRDADWLGLDIGAFELPLIDEETDSGALVPQGGHTDALFLEEYRFEPKEQDLGSVIGTLAALMQRDGAAEALQRQLVIVGNDSFAHLAAHATPVNAHIAIDSRTKTVQGGALWYEETLPPETLLYSCLSAGGARNGYADAPLISLVLGLFAGRPWLQLGGNETVGMGWCAVKDLTAVAEG